MDRLRGAGIGGECRGQGIPALLYADYMVMLADDDDILRRSLARWVNGVKHGQ